MKIFLDTTDVNTIKRLHSTGLIDGVTTNPTLVRKAGRSSGRDHVYAEIADLGVSDISMEVSGTTTEMYEEAQRLHRVRMVLLQLSSYL